LRLLSIVAIVFFVLSCSLNRPAVLEPLVRIYKSQQFAENDLSEYRQTLRTENFVKEIVESVFRSCTSGTD